MTEDDIIEMAHQAGITYVTGHGVASATFEWLQKFASLVAAKEREACAKLCEEYRDEWFKGLGRYEFMGEGADFLADFIRARGEK